MNGILEAIPQEQLDVKKIFSFYFDEYMIEIQTVNGLIQKNIYLPTGIQVIATKLNDLQISKRLAPIEALKEVDEGLYDVKVLYENEEISLDTFSINSNYLTSKEIDEKILKKLKF